MGRKYRFPECTHLTITKCFPAAIKIPMVKPTLGKTEQRCPFMPFAESVNRGKEKRYIVHTVGLFSPKILSSMMPASCPAIVDNGNFFCCQETMQFLSPVPVLGNSWNLTMLLADHVAF